MKKKRYILRAGMLGQFANGEYFTTGFSKNKHIIYPLNLDRPAFTVQDNYDDVDELLHEDNPDFDVLKLYTVDPLVLMRINTTNVVDTILTSADTKLEWQNPEYDDTATMENASPDTAPPTPNSISESEIVVRTSIVIMVNDKEVDLNNLSDTEFKALKTFGII